MSSAISANHEKDAEAVAGISGTVLCECMLTFGPRAGRVGRVGPSRGAATRDSETLLE